MKPFRSLHLLFSLQMIIALTALVNVAHPTALGSEKSQSEKARLKNKGTPAKSVQPLAPSRVQSSAQPQTHDETEGKGEKEKEGSVFFIPWAVPDFDFSISPILGIAFESIEAFEKQPTGTGNEDESAETADAAAAATNRKKFRTLTVEGGIRLGLENIALSEKKFSVTFSPSAGYAYGQRMNLQKQSDLQEGAYQRVLVGNMTRLYVDFFRYSLGLNFGRIFGARTVVEPVSQVEVLQDIGIKTTARTSLHVTFSTGRLFSDSVQSYFKQYSDLWFHFQFNPFLSAVFDFGPGKDFNWYPQSQVSTSSDYLKFVFDWGIFGKLGIAGRSRC